MLDSVDMVNLRSGYIRAYPKKIRKTHLFTKLSKSNIFVHDIFFSF